MFRFFQVVWVLGVPRKDCIGILEKKMETTIMVYYGILWYVMVYYGILWYVMVCYGILWYLMVSYGKPSLRH